MKKPCIAVPIFPGSNGEIDNVKVLKRCGFDCFLFRWNDSTEKLTDCDGYFFGAGFSYEDRGRSGMVAARDPLFQFLHEEAERGKVIIGNCNGAQVLIESGLVPLGDTLRMSLAHNAIRENRHWRSPGFLNEWVWVQRMCDKNRCATSHWDGVMHMPIAHGEGRFVTKDPDLIAELKKSDQIAFCYTNEEGEVSEDPSVTPNGSVLAIAGICNPRGNVVALMPHPERSDSGDAYFQSVKLWIEQKKQWKDSSPVHLSEKSQALATRSRKPLEIFIDTIITNNEERTVEAAAHRIAKTLSLKQYRYIAPSRASHQDILQSLSVFNPNKEVAYVWQNGKFGKWNAVKKSIDPVKADILKGITLLRRNEPDTGAESFGAGSETGICYDCRNVDESMMSQVSLQQVFANPHASVLERII